MSGFVLTGTQQLHYLQEGAGKNLLLAFHGYGNNANIFLPLATKLAPNFTTLSIDLPHHGKSAWPADQPWTKEELAQLVKNLAAKFNANKVSLAGYSLGGRVCLTIAELLPEMVEQITLIAPDGLTNALFYRIVTKNKIGKKLFDRFIQKPAPWLRAADLLERVKLVKPSLNKFVLQYAATEESRSFLKKVWPGLSLLLPDRAQVRTNLRKFQIPLTIFMGQYDAVIPPKQAVNFAKGEADIKVQVLKKGHRLLVDETIPVIAASLRAE